MVDILRGHGYTLSDMIGITSCIVMVVSLFLAIVGYLWKIRPYQIRMSQFFEDWYGERPRPGINPRPGVMMRLAALEEENENLRNYARKLERRTRDLEEGRPVIVNETIQKHLHQHVPAQLTHRPLPVEGGVQYDY